MKPITRAAILVAMLLTLLLPNGAAASRGVYAANSGDDSLTVFDADVDSGTLTLAPNPTIATGDAPQGVVLTPDSRYLYVGNETDGTISAYSVGSDGALTELPASPFPTAPSPRGLTATADGAHLYVAGDGGDVSGYAIAPTGALTELAGSPWDLGVPARGVAASPDSKLQYGTGWSTGTLAGFTIGPGGELAPLPDPIPDPGTSPAALAFTPNGRHLYVASSAGDIAGYSVAPSGALTAVPGSPVAAPSPYGSLAISPDGASLYAPNYNDMSVSGFSVATDGSLAPAADSPYDLLQQSIGAAVTPNGKFLYVSPGQQGPPGTGSAVAGFARGSAGALTPIAGSPFAATGAGGSFGSLAITPSRSPRARIKVVSGSPAVGERVRFNGEESTDADGSIVSYRWRFGTGKPETTTAPAARHTYKKAGTYTATLTVTDSDGCSAKPIYTGQTASCEGAPRAVAQRTFEVVDRSIEKPKVKADGTQKQKGAGIKVVARAGAAEPVDVTATGTLKIKGQGKRMSLGKVQKSVRAEKEKKFKLYLKRGIKADFKVSRALQAKRLVVATVRIRMRDAAGNKFADTLEIRLK
jgi:6-phosphogluconolactonase (cycloisomerase 2 family)